MSLPSERRGDRSDQIDLTKGDITDYAGNELIEVTGAEWLTGYTGKSGSVSAPRF